MSRQYVSDLIGDAYTRWESGDLILISTPTGSGKSSFILRQLLPYAIQHGKEIVYLCNRRVLGEQLNELSDDALKTYFGETSELSEADRSHILIQTYQAREILDNFPGFERNLTVRPEDVYFVYDEAHYFLSDALFNSNTNRWAAMDFQKGVHIFLTATPEPLMCFLAAALSKGASGYGYPRFQEDAFLETLPEVLARQTEERKAANTIRAEELFDRFGMDLCSVPDQPQKKRPFRPETSPFQPGYDFIASACQSEKLFRYHYQAPPDYDRLDVQYFSEYQELLPVIAASVRDTGDRWLIFVDRKDDGTQLLQVLQAAGISAAFVTAQCKYNRSSGAYQEVCSLILEQRFHCRVLVATAVIDCGVSMIDDSLKHIVISQSNQTSFLQMLGRKRLGEQERLNLYVRAFPPKRICGLKNQCTEQLLFLSRFSLLNRKKYTLSPGKRSAYTDGMHGQPALSVSEQNAIVKDLIRKRQTASLLYVPKYLPPYRRSDPGQNLPILNEYRYSKTALYALLYQMRFYEQAVSGTRDTGHRYYFLSMQLSWLNREYDETRWVGYYEQRHRLQCFLADYAAMDWLRESEQKQFCRQLLEIIRAIPALPPAVAKVLPRYKAGSGKLPGKKVVSDILARLEMPYRLASKQISDHYIRETVWRLYPLPVPDNAPSPPKNSRI